MVTLLGSILGFLGSIFPDLLKLFQDKVDRGHELTLLRLQMRFMREGHYRRLEEIQMQGDQQEIEHLYRFSSPKGLGGIERISALVRPLLTYGFFLLYVGVKISEMAYFVFISAEGASVAVLHHVWGEEEQALFAAVMSFWFGQRAMSRFRGGR